MIFRALACDYDGTLASNDRIGAEALAALARAREAGLRLILVTGRSFFELTRVCERLDLFDAVVAENGGVLYFPSAGMIRDEAPPPPPRLREELDRLGIYYELGRVIIGTARADERAVREALGIAGVSLELVYNRAALMLIPTGVSKGTGTRRVVRTLGLSFHDVLALGDAENDLDLFAVCGWAACPENAVPALGQRADWTFPGQDGEGIARAIVGPILGGLLPVETSRRHRIALGWSTESGEAATIPERGINVLIHGDPLSGKSWLTGALVERLLQREYAVCVVDPEGDYRVLARLPGVSWEEIRAEPSVERALGRFDRDPAACVVLDLSVLPHERKVGAVESALRLIRDRRRRHGLPHWVVLDEAHYSLHREGVSDGAIGIEEKGFCLVTYRPSWLRESVMKSVDAFVLARTTAPEELAFLRSCLFGGSPRASPIAVLPALPPGEFVAVQPDGAGGQLALTFVAAPRDTRHVRHLKKYADSRVSSERRFLFRRPDGRLVASADSLTEFRRAVALAEEGVIAYHAGRGDFSRWVLDVFSDPELARHLRKTEVRWARGELRDLRQAIVRPITLRYGGEG